MRLIKYFLILGLTANLQAQYTNAPAGTDTNSLPLSMGEAIKLALEHNLEIRIEQYNPQISSLTLKGSYGAYDPTLNLSAVHTYRKSEGQGYNAASGLPAPASETDTDNFSTDIRGITPLGLSYDIGLVNVYQKGTRGGFDENGNPVSSFFKQYSGDAGGLGSASLTQHLLKDFWVDQPRTVIMLDKMDLQIREQALYAKVMDVVTRVETAYYDLIFAHTNLTVQEKAMELADKLVFENNQKVKIGTMAPLDAKQAESQAATAKADLLGARNQLAGVETNLRQLLTDDYAKWQSERLAPSDPLPPEPPTFNLMDSWQKGLTMRPDLVQQRLDLEKRHITLKYNFNQLFPSLDLIGSYGLTGLDPKSFGGVYDDFRDRTAPHYSYGAILTLPLGNRKARADYKSGKLAVAQSLDILKKLEQDVMVEIDDAVKVARTNFEKITATRQAREFADLALDAETKKLEAGKSTPFVVLQLQRDLTTARSEEIRAKVDYFKALNQLSFRDGTTLEKNNIQVEVK